MKPIFFKICKVIVIGALLWCVMLFHSCSPRYTEPQARKLFGCDTTASKSDTNPPVLSKKDTIHDTIYIPGETVYKESPCDEMKKMHPGQHKKEKKGNTTLTYGKDSTGKEFIAATSDSLKVVSSTYREWWLQTVNNTFSVKDPPVELSAWHKFFDPVWEFLQYVLMLLGVVSTLILVLKYNKSG